MKKYVVLIQNLVTGEMSSIICVDNGELATLLDNLDTNTYSIDSIKGIRNVIEGIDHFCIKNDNLETDVA